MTSHRFDNDFEATVCPANWELDNSKGSHQSQSVLLDNSWYEFAANGPNQGQLRSEFQQVQQLMPEFIAVDNFGTTIFSLLEKILTVFMIPTPAVCKD